MDGGGHVPSVPPGIYAHGSVVIRLAGCTVKFSETPLKMAYGREMNIQFTGNSSGGHTMDFFGIECLWLTLLVKGVNNCLLDNCQISSIPHDCVA